MLKCFDPLKKRLQIGSEAEYKLSNIAIDKYQQWFIEFRDRKCFDTCKKSLDGLSGAEYKLNNLTMANIGILSVRHAEMF